MHKVYKWKACLNVHEGKQEHGVYYWDTYSVVVTWPGIQLMLILSTIWGWHTRQLDYVLATNKPILSVIFTWKCQRDSVKKVKGADNASSSKKPVWSETGRPSLEHRSDTLARYQARMVEQQDCRGSVTIMAQCDMLCTSRCTASCNDNSGEQDS